VRSLALRSKEASRRTAALLQESMALAAGGEGLGIEAADRLGEIVVAVGEATAAVGRIAAGADEQASGLAHVEAALVEMDQVTQQNAASAEQSSAAATELTGQAGALAQLTATFKLEDRDGPARPGALRPARRRRPS